MDNFNSSFMDFGAKAREGRVELPLRSYRKLQMISVEDIGAFAALAFERPREFLGAAFDLAGDALTTSEIAATLSRVRGRQVRSAADEKALPAIRKVSEELAAMWTDFDELGADANLPGLRALHPKLETFEDFLRRTGWARQ